MKAWDNLKPHLKEVKQHTPWGEGKKPNNEERIKKKYKKDFMCIPSSKGYYI